MISMICQRSITLNAQFNGLKVFKDVEGSRQSKGQEVDRKKRSSAFPIRKKNGINKCAYMKNVHHGFLTVPSHAYIHKGYDRMVSSGTSSVSFYLFKCYNFPSFSLFFFFVRLFCCYTVYNVCVSNPRASVIAFLSYYIGFQ